MSSFKSQYVNLAIKYSNDVLDNVIPACKWTKLACDRFLKDLDKADNGWKYHLNEEKAHKACRLFELMPHAKGKWASPTLILQPWNAFIFVNTFGWVDDNDNRRFKVCYVEVPRKNAKTTSAAVVGLVCFTIDDETGAEVYSSATSRDQARICWEIAKTMCDRKPEFCKRFGIETMAHAIVRLGSNSTFRPLSSDANQLDGLSVHCSIIDELHAHKSRNVWDVIETATGSRSQPLIFSITTAGSNRAGICYEQRTYLTKILERVFTDSASDQYFGIIYTIDENDDWTDSKNWIKANPNWDVSVSPEDFQRKAQKAMQMASAQNNFLTKHLNVWVNADTAWMDMVAWEKCGNTKLSRHEFERNGEQAIVGLDLATKRDVAARVDVFRREIDGDYHYYVFGKYYLPEEAVEDSPNSQYSGWVHEGRLIATDGNVTDFDLILDDLVEDRSSIQQIAYDDHQAIMLVSALHSEGMQLILVPMQVKVLSDPMKELEALVYSGRLHHDGCPVLTWMISNTVAHLDVKENIYPRKPNPDAKIDGVVALIMALAAWFKVDQMDIGKPSVYEERGFLTL